MTPADRAQIRLIDLELARVHWAYPVAVEPIADVIPIDRGGRPVTWHLVEGTYRLDWHDMLAELREAS